METLPATAPHADHGPSVPIEGHEPKHPPSASPSSLRRMALTATLHCLAGCAIGEVAGMVIGTALGWGNASTIGLSVLLAFISGFALTALPFLRQGYAPAAALRLAFAADAVSISVMEVVDNAIMLMVPGAMGSSLADGRFWVMLALSLLIAGVVALPVNRWLIARGKGHAVVHRQHG
jgi:hypothetical protein